MARFSGPFGVWNFPILNVMFDLIQGLKQRQGQQVSFSPVSRNIETIKWVDWKNRERVIEIHREVESPV